MKNLFLSSLLVVTVVACKDENVVLPTKTKLLNVEVDGSYTTDGLDNWVIVHDEDGRLLAFKSFESNTTFELETDLKVSDKITVTRLSHRLGNGVHHYSLDSYTKVDKGKTLVYKTNFVTPQTNTGMFNVSVSDVVQYEQYSLSSRVGSSGSASWSSDTDVLNIQGSTYSGISKYILSVCSGSQAKYKVLDNVLPNASYSLSFNDMLPFDMTVNFTFPMCNDAVVRVFGSEPGAPSPNTYNLITRYNSSPSSSIQAVYLNSLTDYTTALTLTYDDYWLEFDRILFIPFGDITWPVKSDFTISTSSINDYSINAKKEYTMREGTWQFSDSENVVNWLVHGPTDEQAFEEMPAEIIAKHPALLPSKMSYKSSKIYTQAFPYDGYVDASFASYRNVASVTIAIGM